MATIHRGLARERTWGVEEQLRARSEQMKPGADAGHEPVSRGTPLGCCRRCSAIVYASDSLVMVAGYLVHGDCAPSPG